jgi:hypothetical protein
VQLQPELERYRTDALYFEQHRQELLRRYPEHWIAVYDQDIVGIAKRLPRLLQKLEKQGLPRGQVFIEHVSSKEDLLTFHAEYQGQRGIFDFDGNMTQGHLTSRTAQRLIREWTSQHREELEQNWHKAREGKTLYRIAPLR